MRAIMLQTIQSFTFHLEGSFQLNLVQERLFGMKSTHHEANWILSLSDVSK